MLVQFSVVPLAPVKALAKSLRRSSGLSMKAVLPTKRTPWVPSWRGDGTR